MLEEYPNLVPTQFNTHEYDSASNEYKSVLLHQPVDAKIGKLVSLYWDVSYENFENAMERYIVDFGSDNEDEITEKLENSWKDQEVINAADTCMKVAYAISNLTLDDLTKFTVTLSAKGEMRTCEEALTKQDAYQYRTFFYCTKAYHWLRGSAFFAKMPTMAGEQIQVFPRDDSPESKDFYQNGTIQHIWKELYNEYCDRVRLYVEEKELYEADSRFVNWTKKDTGVESFTSTPDSLPT